MTTPVREVGLGPLGVTLEQRADGTLLVRSTDPIDPMPANLTSRLVHWATTTPDRMFLAERDSAGIWHSISYAETFAQVRSIASALLARDLSPDRPLVILSGNSIAHALLGLSALHVGIPYAPISPAYALASTDHGKLRHIIAKLTPGLVFADNGDAFAAAIESTVPPGVERVAALGQVCG